MMESNTKLLLLVIFLSTTIILAAPFLVFDFSQESCGSVKSAKRLGNQFVNYSKSDVSQKLFEIIDNLQNGVVTYSADGYYGGDGGSNNSSVNASEGFLMQNESVDDCRVSDIEKYAPLMFGDEDVRHDVDAWLLENGKDSLYNRLRLTRMGYANDWLQLFSACLVFTTYVVLWEAHSFHGWAQFYFVSVELLQRSVNILQTTAFHWDYASVLLSAYDPYYLQYCSLVDLFCYYVPLSQLFCLTALTYDVWRTFGKDTLVADSRNEEKFLQFLVVGVLIPAIYTSFGFLLHHLTDGYLCHPSFETLSDIMIYLVYRYTPSGVLILLNFYMIFLTQAATARVKDECRIVRKQSSKPDTKPTHRLNLYLKLLWILCVLTLLLKPFSRTMMAFGVHLERYDGGYTNMALYILSRTHSCILLFVLLNHGPTRVSLARIERTAADSLENQKGTQNGKKQLQSSENKFCRICVYIGMTIKLAVTRALLQLCNLCSGRLCIVTWQKFVKKKKVLVEQNSRSSLESGNTTTTK